MRLRDSFKFYPLIVLLSIGFLCIGLYSEVSFAKLFVEPAVGGSFGSAPYTKGSTSTTFTAVGGAGELKLGYRSRYLLLAGSLKAAFNSLNSDDVDSDAAINTSFGLGVGWEWNIPIRTFIIFGTSSTTINSDSLSGVDTRLQIGYFFKPNFILNFEYQSSGLESESVEASIKTLSVLLAWTFEANYPDKWWRLRMSDPERK